MNTIVEKIEFASGYFQVHNTKPDFDIIFPKQIHGDRIINAENFQLGIEADGIISSYDKKICAVQTADCLPILYLGRENYSLLHSGWRGLKLGIQIQPQLLELDPEVIHIGPAISSPKYEVREEFLEYFPNSKNIKQVSEKYYFDLKNEAFDSISQAFPKAKITISPKCTYTNPELHSYRENQTSARNWNIFLSKKIC